MNYQGAEIDWLYFDELTHFTKGMFDYIITRLRARKGVGYEPCVRCASNPGSAGHSWVKQMFVDSTNNGEKVIQEVVEDKKTGKRHIIKTQYIPATVYDNPFIQDNYIFNLLQKPKALREALLYGKWDAFEGQAFPEFTNDEGRYSHILDFDVLRLGKKVIENNPNAGSFEFGVVVISEVGKERGNNLENREIKRNTNETNQKNDLFNSWLKMCRHSATVDNYPFIKVFTDEQRPESWGADARDLCDIIYIESNGKQKLAMPFYTIEEMLTEWAFKGFINLYYMMRYLRGDTTLFIYVLKTLTSWLYQRNARFYNRFGYCLTYIEKEAGTMDGTPERKKYYVLNKKIYSRRFTTDCFSDYFNELARKSNIGLNDYMEYETERASVEELKMQNSYFINALYKNAGSN
jgi:hypothetical protein